MYNGSIYNPYQGYGLPRQEVIRVNGKNGAEAYQMAPNSSVLLLDETAPIVWLKTTDGASYPTISGYVISPLKEKVETAKDDYIRLEERIAKLEGMLANNGQKQSDTAKPKSAKQQQ